MTELMRTLYQYGSTARITCGMEDYEQYCENSKLLEKNLQALQEQLNPDEMNKLENFLYGQNVLHDLELEATFCSGFSIGQELSRV